MADDEDDIEELIRREEEDREERQAQNPASSHFSPSLPSASHRGDPHLPSLESHEASGGGFIADDGGGGGFMPDDEGEDSNPPSRRGAEFERKYTESASGSPPSSIVKRKFDDLTVDEEEEEEFDVEALAEIDAALVAHERAKSSSPSPPPSSDVLACQDCGNLAYNVPYFKAFHLAVCNSCQSANPPLYSLITKSTARTQHLLSDSDLNPLPFLLKANPTRGSFAHMKLYRLSDVERISRGRWGDGVEEEKQRREMERLQKDVEKRKKSRMAVEKERKVREYRIDKLDVGHKHAFVDDKRNGKQKCKECGFTLDFEEL